jgi:putative toxin-antitoxin system antitoxin component (TIGR02293 family)
MLTPSEASNSRNELIEAVREGLPFTAFEELRGALELSNEELAVLLNIPRRTVTKRKSDGAFTPTESNAISRVARVFREAGIVFEEPARGRRWLKTPLPALGGSAPLELLDTDPGAQAVSELIRQLAWGIYP